MTTARESPPKSPSKPRLAGIDALRGLAIVTMVFANAAAPILASPHPFGARLYGTFAAPIFVMLAGMMVGVSVARDRERNGGSKYTLGYFLVRGGLVLLVAIAVDVFINGCLPLLTYDVLYTIGLSLPIAFLASRAPVPVRLALPLLIFAMTPVLQSLIGYRTEISQPGFDTPLAEILGSWSDVLQRLFIDGWFPLFPWLGFALTGVAVAALLRPDGLGLRLPAIAGPLLLVAGSALWWFAPGPMVERMGYTEMFYPASPGFMLTAVALLITLLPLMQWISETMVGRALQVFGRCSLLMYVLHLWAIAAILKQWHEDLPLARYIPVYVGFLVALWLCAWGVDVFKRRLRERRIELPAPLAVLLGG